LEKNWRRWKNDRKEVEKEEKTSGRYHIGGKYCSFSRGETLRGG